MTFVVFLLVLSFLVLIHEAGHYWTARKFGVKVEEFGFGYPPKAKTLFFRKGVEFTLNWLPFGGFVRLAGEVLEDEKQRDKSDKSLFYNQVWWKRLIVILAGAVINFGFGILAFGILFSILGIPEAVGVEIFEVSENSPASEAGLMVGDMIEGVVEKNGEVVDVESTKDFVDELKPYAGEVVELVVEREGEELRMEVGVRKPEDIPEGDGAVGIAIQASEVEFVKYVWWQRPIRGIWYGLGTAFEFSWMVLGIFGQMISDIFTQAKVPEEVAGPVGIVYQAYKQDILKEGLVGILNWSAVLSIQLAIINVLPIPAMDGGRAFFIVIEKLMGKRYKLEYEQKAVVVGMLFLLALIILVSIKDVRFILMDTGIL